MNRLVDEQFEHKSGLTECLSDLDPNCLTL